MQPNSALAAVLSGQFLLAESAVPAFMLQSARLLTEGGPAAPRPTNQPAPAAVFAIDMAATSLELRGYGSLDEVPAGSVAITTVSGVMMPDDSWDYDYGYIRGTRTLATRLQQADAHPNIVGHVVALATPGGSTLGLEHFAGVIASTTKPTVGFVEMMCSAGLWAGSGCDRLVIARTGIAGSIGTKWDGMDFSGFYEKMGIKSVTVTATDSSDKTKMFDEALKGKPGLLRSQLLDPLNDEFLATVKANLPNATGNTLTGKLFVGQAAVENGLADQLGSLQEAIQLAFDLADEAGLVGASAFSATTPFSHSTTNQPTNMGLFSKSTTTAFAAVAALANKTGLTAETTKAANDELVAAGVTDAAIITQAEYTGLVAKAGRADAAEAKVTELTASNTKLTTDLTASQAEVARLGALGGDTPTTGAKKEGDDQGETKAHAWFNKDHDHNKEAAALLG